MIGHDYVFPAMIGWEEFSRDAQVAKIREEIAEVEKAKTSWDELCECFDVIHACETRIRKICSDTHYLPEDAIAHVKWKNSIRGYYKR